MAAEDYLPFDFLDEEEEQGVRCKYCGRDDLEWEETEKGWRLFTPTGKLHTCKQREKKSDSNNPTL